MAPVWRQSGCLAVCAAIAFLAAVPAPATAGDAGMQVAELDAKGRKIIEEWGQSFKELDADNRLACAMGDAPRWVGTKLFEDDEKARTLADVAGICVAHLEGLAGEGRLPELYRELLSQMGGDVAGADAWPRAIGAAILAGKTEVGIGRHKSIEVKSALAFDAGFTVAYQEGKNGKGQDADAAQLLTLAQTCVSQRQDAATCFSVGYVYGANAVRGKTLSSR